MAQALTNVQTEEQIYQKSHIPEDIKEDAPNEYSSLSVWQKYGVLAIVATAAFLATLSANIYFPALGVIQKVICLYQRDKGSYFSDRPTLCCRTFTPHQN
jgi:uridine phosphorylase